MNRFLLDSSVGVLLSKRKNFYITTHKRIIKYPSISMAIFIPAKNSSMQSTRKIPFLGCLNLMVNWSRWSVQDDVAAAADVHIHSHKSICIYDVEAVCSDCVFWFVFFILFCSKRSEMVKKKIILLLALFRVLILKKRIFFYTRDRNWYYYIGFYG